MKVINPLFRNQNDKVTAAHSSCNCICNVDIAGQHDSTGDKAWWWGNPDCGCGCNSQITDNNTSNHTRAYANS